MPNCGCLRIDRPSEDVRRVLHHVLVDAGIEADKHHQGLAFAPARATRLLEERRERSRVADDDAGVETADVDT